MITTSKHLKDLKIPILGRPIEVLKRELGLDEVIQLSSNENPLGSGKMVQIAIEKQISRVNRYPDPNGFELKNCLSNHLGIRPEQIVVGNGSSEVIDLIVRAYCTEGELILFPKASFIGYKLSAQNHGIETVEAPIDAHLNFDPEELVNLVRDSKKMKVVFIGIPNNPTGTFIKRQELYWMLNEIGQIRNGSVLTVLDYAYWEYVTSDQIASPNEILMTFRNSIVLRTFSKFYGLAGMRVGYGMGPSELIKNIERIRHPYNLNTFSHYCAGESLKDLKFIKKTQQNNLAGMKYWTTHLKALEIPFWESQGNFLLVNVKAGLSMEASEVYLECLRKGVVFCQVGGYGLPEALRITIGSPQENETAVTILGSLKNRLN